MHHFLVRVLILTDRKPPGVGRGRGRGREDGSGRQTKGIGRGMDDGGKSVGGRGRAGPGGKPAGKGMYFLRCILLASTR